MRSRTTSPASATICAPGWSKPLATRPASDVERALLEKGMERDENHHHMYRKTLQGVTHLVTRISHGSGGTIDNHLGKLMANQGCLQLQEFWRLVDCPPNRGRVGSPHRRAVRWRPEPVPGSLKESADTRFFCRRIEGKHTPPWS